MAEDAPKKIHPLEPVIVLLFVGALLGALLMQLDRFLSGHYRLGEFLRTLWLFLQGQATFAELVGSTHSPFIAAAIFALRVFSFVASAFLIWFIITTYKKYKDATDRLKATIKPPKEIFYGVEPQVERYVNPKWAKVIAHINSENPSDWKLAILEADIMLSEMLDRIGYHGATIGDKLKSIEPSDFPGLQEAWEAHKVRNSIAHEGSDYAINKPEAERVIKLFKKVFEQSNFI